MGWSARARSPPPRPSPRLDLINSVSAYRRERYRGNPNFPVYGKGWLRRLDSITASATNDATPVQHFT
jgi:lysozyme family protein